MLATTAAAPECHRTVNWYWVSSQVFLSEWPERNWWLTAMPPQPWTRRTADNDSSDHSCLAITAAPPSSCQAAAGVSHPKCYYIDMYILMHTCYRLQFNLPFAYCHLHKIKHINQNKSEDILKMLEVITTCRFEGRPRNLFTGWCRLHCRRWMLQFVICRLQQSWYVISFTITTSDTKQKEWKNIFTSPHECKFDLPSQPTIKWNVKWRNSWMIL